MVGGLISGSSCLRAKVSLGKILNPTLLSDALIGVQMHLGIDYVWMRQVVESALSAWVEKHYIRSRSIYQFHITVGNICLYAVYDVSTSLFDSCFYFNNCVYST